MPSNYHSNKNSYFLLGSHPKRRAQALKSSSSEPKNQKRASHLTTKKRNKRRKRKKMRILANQKSKMKRRLPRSQKSPLRVKRLMNSSCNLMARGLAGRILDLWLSCLEPWLIRIIQGGSSPVRRLPSRTLSISTCRRIGVG